MSKIKSAILVLSAAILSAFSSADGVPPGYENKSLPTYKHETRDCYVLLKPQLPYVESSDAPICKAVLVNMNKFCGDASQYNHRTLHASTKELFEPKWQQIDTKNNLDLVKEIVVAQTYERFQADLWRSEKERVNSLVMNKKLRIYKADFDVDGQGKIETVYKLDNLHPDDDDFPGGNQAIYMVAEFNGRGVASGFERWSLNQVGDIWGFGNRWFLVGFYGNNYKQYMVREIANPTGGRATSSTVCTFQNSRDRQGGR